ncbi:hypothetical protein CBP52_10995 [Cellulomonas sp. PSBB021]|nr:hypothetical protein CBP52_10995 [Cellulomonas sp. PSBB021]
MDADGGIPVLRFVDPFARWRLDVEADELTDPPAEMVATCWAIEAAGEPEGRTRRSARRDAVVELLEDWGVDDAGGRLDEAIARRLVRRARRAGRLVLTPAGTLNVVVALEQERELERRGFDDSAPDGVAHRPETSEAFALWLRDALGEIARLVRETAAVQALWVRGEHVSERQVQAFVFGMLSKYASAAGLDCRHAVLLAVAFDDSDLAEGRIERVRGSCEKWTAGHIELVLLDARVRRSASKDTPPRPATWSAA